MYGVFYIILGVFFSAGFTSIIHIFPLPILGVILLFEGLSLTRLVAETAAITTHFAVAILVGLMCVGLPYGYLAGLIIGTVLILALERPNGRGIHR